MIVVLPDKLEYLDNCLVESSNVRLDMCSFQESVKSSHCTLVLRDNNTGKAVTSGTFFDALKYRKPFFYFIMIMYCTIQIDII